LSMSDTSDAPRPARYYCPCCGYRTFVDPPGSYDICPICFWEDDDVQFDDPDLEGGANGVSLREAQRNFVEFGACEREMLSHVRPPKEGEERDPNWRLL
jgi:hypothetical protein